MKPKEYERAVLERFKTIWPPPRFEAKHDTKLPGRKSRKRRQIDVAVFEAGETKPFLIIEAKRRGRAIDLVGAGATMRWSGMSAASPPSWCPPPGSPAAR
jgi:hypothetical protein